jgi:hypothetical protein
MIASSCGLRAQQMRDASRKTRHYDAVESWLADVLGLNLAEPSSKVRLNEGRFSPSQDGWQRPYQVLAAA